MDPEPHRPQHIRAVTSPVESIDSADLGPFWSRTVFLNWLSLATFIGLVAFHGWWWNNHHHPIAWGLLLGTPIFCFVPSGVLVSITRRSWAAAWAQAHGFDHDPKPSWPVPDWDFPPFSISRARRHRIRQGLRGRVGDFPATYFHYSWWNNNRVNVSSYTRTVFILALPAALPRLTVGVTLDHTTGQRVEFESADFRDKFAVYSTDQRFAHAVFTPRTIDTLVELSDRTNVFAVTKFEIAGDLLIGVSTLGSRPAQITQIFAAMHTIAAGIPPFIWTDRGSVAYRKEQ